MSWLIEKIRSWFCVHEYECIDSVDVYETFYGYVPECPTYHKWTYICKKCGRKKIITNR